MKTVKNIAEIISELDFFALSIRLRYKNNADFKTFTSAIITIGLIAFFSWVSITSFINMINRNTIKQILILSQQPDPVNTKITTDSFMFAVSLNGVDMSQGNRYFNFNLSTVTVDHGNKSKYFIPMQVCSIEQWKIFGPQFENAFTKLKLQQWLCPSPRTTFQLQGKYSSDIFKYMKIGISNCTGIVNGLGCRTESEIQTFFTSNQVFQLNFYFTNKLLNPGQKLPSETFLDDSNYFTFSYSIGGVANIYLSDYRMETDNSLLPYQDMIVQNGKIISDSTIQNIFPVNNLITTEFLKVYLRKSPNFSQIKRSFYKFDYLLAYIGGLFGLIALIINVPLYYYNILTFQLSLATELFSQKNEKNQKNQKYLNTQNDQKGQMNQKFHDGKKIQQMQQIRSTKINNTDMKQQKLQNYANQQNQGPFSVNSFNFLLYIIYAPFHLLKLLGCKKLQNKKLSPYYDALSEVRKQIDIMKILKSLSYFNRVTECLLDQDQRKLLHLFPKKNLHEAHRQRKYFKLHKKINSLHMMQSAKILMSSQQDRQRDNDDNDQYFEIKKLKMSFIAVKNKKDKVSKRILRNLDETILQRLGQHDLIERVTKREFKSSDQNQHQHPHKKKYHQKQMQTHDIEQQKIMHQIKKDKQ